ncbi:NADH dehydrogenase subunit M [Rubritalea squalenifaciens DSM 18772]|uniref:NADH dehydrogenase subunit M n=1 Tax=Rubritalea squalenifaciens DSM 18772 TaxID=1123071 RepID=A0A1M6J518_9BACT|nr:NADH-quinone oxidoreductase subunit M [Rubritalea squalenifaciens]SHJ41773.1 NADH dehydrogenase subunit M [Rubritalea squalenifaciens DSM 18772]
MMLLALILIPILAAVAIFFGAPARLTTLGAAAVNLVTSIAAVLCQSCASGFSLQVLENPSIHLSLGIDGISSILLLLSTIVTLAAALSGTCPEGKEKLWFGSILLIAAGAIGAFVSTDLFFFYAFHELALIPTFLMIGILGRGDRKEAAWKATVYLAFGSIVLLAGILLAAGQVGSFAFEDLKAIADVDTQKNVAILLIIGFGTLVSLFPFHSWAAPAYASAPAPVAMLHSGVLKKFGLYGLLRVGLAVAPEGMQHWLNLLLVLLLCNIIWVGLVTINQKRLDLMLGNSSVMHMGYIFLAIAALIASDGKIQNADGSYTLAASAATLLMFAHGISIALSFALADRIEAKTKTLEINQLGGLAKTAPRLAFLFGLAGMASIGLPGLANFAGEVMVFFSGFEGWNQTKDLGPVQIATIIAIWGVVISAVYMLRAFRHTFQGDTLRSTEHATDLSLAEKAPAILLAAVLLVVGFYPNILLNLLK